MIQDGDPNILPDDYWHSFIYVHLDWLSCGTCKNEPDIEWAWRNIDAGKIAAQVAVIRIVERLKADGWTMYRDELCCPDCAAKRASPPA